jgi:mannose-6-phosphate isomerase-like protein (cupin superfamily)
MDKESTGLKFYGEYPDKPNDKKVRVISKNKRIPVVNGTLNKILIEFFVSTDNMHCGIFEIAPNSRGDEVSPHEGDEFYYILQGKGIFCVNGDDYYTVEEEEACYLPAGSKHYWLNFSDEKLRVLFVVAPDL